MTQPNAPLPATPPISATHAPTLHDAQAPDPGALWPLLERQMALYTCGDSTSVPVELAGELLASVLYCLHTAQAAGQGGSAPPPAQLLAGQRLLTQQAEQAKRLLAQVRTTAPPVANRAYHDSLAALKHFFTHYDIRFFAHRPPALLDYPLFQPVPDTLHGVHYAAAWLDGLYLENRFLQGFDAATLHKRLLAHHPDYPDLHLNLFEPVFTSTLGCALAGGDIAALSIPEAGQEKLYTLFRSAGGLPPPDYIPLLQKAVHRLCTALHLWDTAARRTLAAHAATLLPRLTAGSRRGFARLFPTL